MTVPFGGGHHATARTLADLLRTAEPAPDVTILDAITEAWPSFSRRTTQAYVSSTGSPGGRWFRLYYTFSDRYPQPLRWFASAAFSHFARRFLKNYKPDLIIATFPFLAHVAARACAQAGVACPIVTVITDAGHVQGIWLAGRESHVLAATEDTVAYARRRKLPVKKVSYLGFPVAAEFAARPSQTEARKELGLESRFTILVTAGGLGMNPHNVLNLARSLSSLPYPAQIIFIAGKNEHLRRALEQLTFPPSVRVRVEGFTSRMALYMRAADIVCSKAGWLTICEALASERPLLLFDAIPGHEEENAQYVTRHSLGVYKPDPVQAVAFIERAIRGPETLNRYRKAINARPSPASVRARLRRFYMDLLK